MNGDKAVYSMASQFSCVHFNWNVTFTRLLLIWSEVFIVPSKNKYFDWMLCSNIKLFAIWTIPLYIVNIHFMHLFIWRIFALNIRNASDVAEKLKSNQTNNAFAFFEILSLNYSSNLILILISIFPSIEKTLTPVGWRFHRNYLQWHQQYENRLNKLCFIKSFVLFLRCIIHSMRFMLFITQISVHVWKAPQKCLVIR